MILYYMILFEQIDQRFNFNNLTSAAEVTLPTPTSSVNSNSDNDNSNNSDNSNNDSNSSSSTSSRNIKFLQLYTSRSFNSRRNDLLKPDNEDEQQHGEDSTTDATTSNSTSTTTTTPSSSAAAAATPSNLTTDNTAINQPTFKQQQNTTLTTTNGKKQHVLSPLLVNAISSNAQVVWANCPKQEGLLGRSDMRLQTAVGMPVAMDSSGNMCIVVMFSPRHIQTSNEAIEFIKLISQGAASTKIPCLLPVVDANQKKLAFDAKRFSEWENSEMNVAMKQEDVGEGVNGTVSGDDFFMDGQGFPVKLLTNQRSISSTDSRSIGIGIDDENDKDMDIAVSSIAFLFMQWKHCVRNYIHVSVSFFSTPFVILSLSTTKNQKRVLF